MLNPIAYIKEVNVELKRVTWPTKQEIVRLTTVVIVSSVLVGLFLSALDYVFTKLLGVIIG
ncbi:preprotein translocase subunit SecE [Microgenomates group bacterium RIFCSPLOWO2_01_FULL_47_10]|nr:MAG: preprotein translocase subunit SecE [Microgenomates group bacterium RIFCSPLOWO2_01_FULL_47_10]